MTADFLLELLSEEIPARMQSAARNDLARMFAAELDQAGLKAEAIDVHSTPRRLALIARGLPLKTPATRIETKGPRVGAPEQAISGFLQKYSLSKNQLVERNGVYFAERLAAGRPTTNVLAFAVERIVRGFPWPKSMRWGEGDLRWVRPLHSILAMLGEEIVPVSIHGIVSGAATVGHRFHHPGPITIGGAHDYRQKLQACHVVVDQKERERIIREGTEAAAKEAGLSLVPDEGLVVENAGLTEWPVPLLGRFDAESLDVPREVIVLTMRTNQKYFACTDKKGALAPAFVCIANIDAKDGGDSIVEGNRRVLAARLADARFFWEQDLQVPLDEQAQKLSGIVFHDKLGSIADKVDRVAKLARWLVEQQIVTPAKAGAQKQSKLGSRLRGNDEEVAKLADLADLADRAVRLAKADLVTGMVGEFPELQGVIGGYLARAQGEPDAIADAVRDHYKPVGQSDEVPTAPVTVAVSLADKLDTLAAFFYLNERPTGSKDPYALRRAALQAIRLITSSALRIRLLAALDRAAEAARQHMPGPALTVKRARTGFAEPHDADSFELLDFFADRLKVQQREAGVRHDLIDAVFALGGEDDLVRLLARVKALQAFVETGEGGDLLTAYKRAANILKKEKWDQRRHPGPEPGSALPANDGPKKKRMPDQVRHDGLEAEEQALIAALDAAEPTASKAVEAEDFTAAMAALASLRGPVDSFFEQVTVNDPDKAKRARRLGLLARFRDAVHKVADFSRIEG